MIWPTLPICIPRLSKKLDLHSIRGCTLENSCGLINTLGLALNKDVAYLGMNLEWFLLSCFHPPMLDMKADTYARKRHPRYKAWTNELENGIQSVYIYVSSNPDLWPKKHKLLLHSKTTPERDFCQIKLLAEVLHHLPLLHLTTSASCRGKEL